MITRCLLMLCTVSLLVACGKEQQVPENITGEYYGILPCADCPGIFYKLKLNQDHSFSETRFYLESEADTLTFDGSFQMEADSVIVLSKDKPNPGLDRLKFSNGELKVLNEEGKENTTQLAEYYVLKTTKPSLETFRSGSEIQSNFSATGNEPFWSFSMDEEKQRMTFKPMDGDSIVTKLPEPKEMENGLYYEASVNGNMLKISIFNEKCQDNMSGELFSHRVSLSIRKDGTEERILKGCGEYEQSATVKNRLKGTWILKSINGRTVEQDSTFNVPSITIQPSEGRVMGMAGCNQFSGNIKSLNAESISVSKVISTKMACPGLDLETEYLQALTEKPLHYKLNGKELVFEHEEVKLIFLWGGESVNE